MATPRRTALEIPGTLGPIFVDVRSAGTTPRPAVVGMHGFKGFKDWGFWPPLADRLARAGLTVVTFNTSGSGVDASGEPTLPERFSRNTYSAELADLAAVVDALHDGTLGVPAPPSVGLMGHSRGGGMAVLHAARDPRITALVTWAGIAQVDRWGDELKRAWRRQGSINVTNARTGQVIPLSTDILDDVEQHRDQLDILAAAARITVPWLIIHGTGDESVPDSDARALAHAAPHARLLLLEGASHTFGARHPWAGAEADTERLFDETVQTVGGRR